MPRDNMYYVHLGAQMKMPEEIDQCMLLIEMSTRPISFLRICISFLDYASGNLKYSQLSISSNEILENIACTFH